MAGGEQPGARDERGPALEVPVAVERGLPRPGARRRAAAADHPAPAHVRRPASPVRVLGRDTRRRARQHADR